MKRSLKRKFVRGPGLASMFVLLGVFVASVLIYSFLLLRNVDSSLQQISQLYLGAQAQQSRHSGNMYRNSREYFFVTVEKDGSASYVMDFCRETGQEQAQQLYAQVRETDKQFGNVDYFRYYRRQTGDTLLYTFLDCEQQVTSARYVVFVSGGVTVLTILIIFQMLWIIAPKVLRPILDNVEKQKRFITDASHEIKTPVTVISSYADVLCMEQPENEWAQGIRKEAKSMSKLVSDLVMLSRWDEEDPGGEKVSFELSQAVWDIVEPYVNLAENQNKTFNVNIEDGLYMTGDEAMIQTAIATLLENAVKYSLPQSAISLNLHAERHKAVLQVVNRCEPMDEETLSRLFERFYRGDRSRSRKTGGNGVGLSIAKAVIERNGGKITATMAEENEICFRAVLPLSK